ncbi:MAG: hypothetical protein ACRDOI_12270 [Trebonia sp.]
MAEAVNAAGTVAVFGGDGCEGAHAEVTALAAKLSAPVGYTLKGKQFLEHDNANAVGMTGLLGYGGCHHAINHADVLLMLGTDFPFSSFLPHGKPRSSRSTATQSGSAGASRLTWGWPTTGRSSRQPFGKAVTVVDRGGTQLGQRAVAVGRGDLQGAHAALSQQLHGYRSDAAGYGGDRDGFSGAGVNCANGRVGSAPHDVEGPCNLP